MENYVEAYGAMYKKLFFFAVRFKLPILKVKISNTVEPLIDTPNILLLYSKVYSKQPIYKESENRLTFLVKESCKSNAISVENNDKAELLLSILKKCHIEKYCYHNSVLYGFGNSEAIPFTYTIMPRNLVFKSLYKITKAYQHQRIDISHFVLCHHFKRNKLKWENWHSWWFFIKTLINEEFKKKTGMNITLQKVNNIRKIIKYSLNLNIGNQTELSFCEIGLEETKHPGILCASINNTISYISPMIVGEEFSKSVPIKDKNNQNCNLWLPLYTNIETWWESTIYFYSNNLSLNIKYIQDILKLLNFTTIEKYKLIQKNIYYINNILTNNYKN